MQADGVDTLAGVGVLVSGLLATYAQWEQRAHAGNGCNGCNGCGGEDPCDVWDRQDSPDDDNTGQPFQPLHPDKTGPDAGRGGAAPAGRSRGQPDSPGPSGTREPLQPRTLSEHQRKLLTLSVERAVLAGPTAPRGHPPGAAPYEPWLRRVVAAIEEASSSFPAKEKAGGGWGGRKIAYKKGKGMCYHLP